jgi:D-glycero-D-manno-heptose 1,7-bisphosphate phosphatase
MKRACFLDRDGILNEIVMRGATVSSPWNVAEFHLLSGAAALVEAVFSAGFIPVVVTNQPDLERGNLPAAELEKMHDLLRRKLGIAEIEVCGSGDDSDPRRKPNPGMIWDAAERLELDLTASLLVGDSLKDIKAGRSAGVRTILLETSYNAAAHGLADENCQSHRQIIDLIVGACDKGA